MSNHVSTTIGALLFLTLGLAACSPGGSPAGAGASSAAPTTAGGSGSLTFSGASSDMSGDTTSFSPDALASSTQGIFRPAQDGVLVVAWQGASSVGHRTMSLNASGTKAAAGETYDLTPSTLLKSFIYVDKAGTSMASTWTSESGSVAVSAGTGTGLTFALTNVKMKALIGGKGTFSLNGTLQANITRLAN
jgi:hypothetical protein